MPSLCSADREPKHNPHIAEKLQPDAQRCLRQHHSRRNHLPLATSRQLHPHINRWCHKYPNRAIRHFDCSTTLRHRVRHNQAMREILSNHGKSHFPLQYHSRKSTKLTNPFSPSQARRQLRPDLHQQHHQRLALRTDQPLGKHRLHKPHPRPLLLRLPNIELEFHFRRQRC